MIRYVFIMCTLCYLYNGHGKRSKTSEIELKTQRTSLPTYWAAVEACRENWASINFGANVANPLSKFPVTQTVKNYKHSLSAQRYFIENKLYERFREGQIQITGPISGTKRNGKHPKPVNAFFKHFQMV